MTAGIMAERDSSAEELERAYNVLASGYREVVSDYVRRHKIPSVSDLAEVAGCEYPETVAQFIEDVDVAVTGKDLSRLIGRVDGVEEWLKRVEHVQIHFSMGYPRPMEYPDRPPSSEVIPEETDSAIREALAKISWFYLKSSEKFLAERDAEIHSQR